MLDLLAFPGAASVVHTIFRIVAAIALIRLIGFALFRLLLPLMGRALPRIVEDVVILVLYVIYGFVQLRGAGVDLSSIVTTSAILTAVIAFAMQDTLGNLLGGLAIQIDNTIQVGDWVAVDGLQGQVRDIRWRSTLIETRNWETVVIPNSQIMKGRVHVLGKREGRPLQWRRNLRFMVDPRVPPARVIATVEDEMCQVDYVVERILEQTDGFGADYTFEATGNVAVMRQAVESARMGWGLATVCGVAGKGETLDVVPRFLITGRRVAGSSFGGVKGRDQVPDLVERWLAGEIDVDPFVSHKLTLDDVNRGFELMEAQDGIRSVIEFPA
jgi:small-conductance mechanosensitive channel